MYGDLCRNFDAEKVVKQGREVSIVAVFAGMLVQLYKGLIHTLLFVQPNYYVLLSLFSRSHLTIMHSGIGFTVRSTSASKYYLDLDTCARAPRKVWTELTQ
jgi:replication factor A1